MVVLLVILTVVLLLTAEWIAGRRRKAAQTPAPARARRAVTGSAGVPAQRYLHPGHSWARLEGPEAVVVGVDDFAQRLLGRLDEVTLPEPGARVAQGEPLFTIRRGRRELTHPAPFSGVVAGVNRELAKAPRLVNDSPYERGWVATLAPANLALELRNLLRGALAERWEEATRMQLVDWFAPQVGHVLQDGGELVECVSDQLTDGEWDRVVQDFFPAYGPPGAAPSG